MWLAIATFLLVGYLCFGRSFAYIGFPPLHVFISEIALAAFLTFGPTHSRRRWPWVGFGSEEFSRFRKWFLWMLGYGLFELVRGVAIGHPPLDAVRDLAFCYYPIYFFFGVWACWKRPEFLQRCVRIAAVVNGIYGLAYILILNRVFLFFPGVSSDAEPVPIFGQPLYTAPILLGLLSLEKDLRRGALLLLLNVAVMIGMLIRAEWAAFVIGFLLLLWVTKNVRRAVVVTAVAFTLIAVMYVSNFSYAGPETRGRTISARDLVGQVVAPFSKETAANFTSDDASLELSEGTTVWRTLYWVEIWNSVHENFTRSLLGFGYGYPLGTLIGYLGVVDVRTPHNFVMYVLAYEGWAGVFLYVLFQTALAKILWKSYRVTGQPFGIVVWATMLVFACFTPLFEVPQGAIPFYLLMGGSCGVLFRVKEKAVSRRMPNLATAAIAQ